MVGEQLGAGGMGTVYRAYDSVRRVDVALKQLQHVDGAMLYRFKNEFRSLTDLVHPNLVTLYELQRQRDAWFFTMELIEGVSFLDYVRPHRHLVCPPTPDTERPPSTVTVATRAGDHNTNQSSKPLSKRRQALIDASVDLARLEATTAQLVAGIQALHQAGMLHRDLKPSNVLVDRNGRVVVCDFGLVVDVARVDDSVGFGDGTPAYMSPEQAEIVPLDEASDWYSVGVMLYEALTGKLPFEGTQDFMLAQKQTSRPEPPKLVDPRVPERWNRVCVGLLERDPAARMDGAQLMAALGRAEAPRTTPAPANVPFVGREHQLARLWECFERANNQRRCVSVFVHGPAAIGKSTLVDRFLNEVLRENAAVVLRGRCHERESVPFKALDALVDALAAHLATLPAERVRELVPPDATPLVRLFPVLRRVDGVPRSRAATEDGSDPQQLRTRAFEALSNALTGLAASTPTVVALDDLHWGDADSGGFLADLLHRDDAPPVLFVASYRDTVETNPLHRVLLDPNVRENTSNDAIDLELLPFGDEEARRLAYHLVGEGTRSARQRVDHIIEEAHGNPLFIIELARVAATTSDAAAIEGLTLDDVLARRIDALPDEARALLTISAIAGGPMPLSVVGRAARVRDEASALVVLQAEHLVRTQRVRDVEHIETYHGRIRDSVSQRLDAKHKRQLHRRIARSLESSVWADPQALVQHWIGAGDTKRAGEYALKAATRSEQALAFDRAVHHLQLALDLCELDEHQRRKLLTRLGDANDHAGRPLDAPAPYLEAAKGLTGDAAFELRRRALEHLLRSGQLNRAQGVMKQVLSEVGMKLPSGRVRTIASIVMRRARLRMRGLHFHERPIADIDPHTLRRLDVFWTVASGLGFVNPILAAEFHGRHLAEALDAGDPFRASLAVSVEGAVRSFSGKHRERVIEAETLAKQLAEQSGHPYAIGIAAMTSGTSRLSFGEWKVAAELSARSVDNLLDASNPARWEATIGSLSYLAALVYLGAMKQVTRLVRRQMREADRRNDQWLLGGTVTGRCSAAWLAMDQPDEGLRELDRVADVVTLDEQSSQHRYLTFLHRTGALLYRGDALAAWQHVEKTWPRLGRSMIFRLQLSRIEGLFLRARCALAAAVADSTRRPGLLKQAEACAQRMQGEQTHWGNPLALLIRAGVSVARGDSSLALEYYRSAAVGFDAADMALHAAVARLRSGQLIGGDEGAGLVDKATTWMTGEEIRKPSRMAEVMAPRGDLGSGI